VAGPCGIFTRFPFHSLGRAPWSEKDTTKVNAEQQRRAGGNSRYRSLETIHAFVVLEYVSSRILTRRYGTERNLVSGSFVNLPAVMTPQVIALLTIPSTVKWSYSIGGVIFAIGLGTIFLRGDWQKTRGLDKLILFGPVFYAAPIAAFGTEHYTLTADIASLIPAWIPWHIFWTYFVGTCFIAAALSLVTGIQTRLSASLLALNFFLFVVLMDAPALPQNLRDRFMWALTLRELSFCAGPLALAASLSGQRRERAAHFFATIARYFIAVTILFYSFEQFLHADHVPGLPLERVTPTWIPLHTFWTYLNAAAYAVAGVPLLLGKKTRAATTWIGLTVFFIVLVVYVPIAIVDRASLDNGLNYFGDTLMFCGTILLLAGAMPREA
jgi:uncharacterized membrane protein YphA (DoxX/SURF4 family)